MPLLNPVLGYWSWSMLVASVPPDRARASTPVHFSGGRSSVTYSGRLHNPILFCVLRTYRTTVLRAERATGDMKAWASWLERGWAMLVPLGQEDGGEKL